MIFQEERNNYRDSLDAKQKEQADLKVEMEKMSDLISELRVNCQTLQTELSEVRAVSKDRSDAAVQASLLQHNENSRPSTRKLSSSSITQESIRKARLVFNLKIFHTLFTLSHTVSLVVSHIVIGRCCARQPLYTMKIRSCQPGNSHPLK